MGEDEGIQLDKEDEPVLDGVRLATLGPTGVCRHPEMTHGSLHALQLASETQGTATTYSSKYEDARTALAPRPPRVVVLGCDAGRALLAAEHLPQVVAAVEPEWTILECTRASIWSQDVRMVCAP